jgi:hypothetical protein
MICALSCEEKEEIWTPSDLNVSGITSYTALLGWGGVGDEYEVVMGDSVWVTANRGLAVKRLTPDTDFRWSVRAVKGGTYSDRMEHSFRTLPLPSQPTDLNAVVSYRIAELSWSGEERKYEVKTGDNIYQVSGTKHVLNELEPATTYTWSVRATRGDEVSEWAQAEFTTLERPVPPNAQITVNDLNVMRANTTITPNSSVSAYAAYVISKELYQIFVDEFTGGDEVMFMELIGNFYPTGEPSAETWELNGETGYEYYLAVLLYDNAGEPHPEVIKHEFASPAYQDNLAQASATITVSNITSSSAGIVVASAGAGAFGFYDGLFVREEYEEILADYGEEYIRQYLAFYGYLYLAPEIDDWVWESLEPATEYIIVVSPFNANGIHGYGDLVAETFTTLSSASGATPKSKFYGERKKLKKALTRETAKLLDLKKKK